MKPARHRLNSDDLRLRRDALVAEIAVTEDVLRRLALVQERLNIEAKLEEENET